MPPKTSKKIKQLQLELQIHDKQLARAMDYVRKHSSESKAKIAKAYGVNASTLRRRCRGIAIVGWCRRMSHLFFPVTMEMLVSIAVAILQARSFQFIPGSLALRSALPL
ncbi:hypothetical protein BGX38DRAFT_1274280 [Terfezia claveryi]|nr:hypothetical protein BGX38DRAFT_1274280 [Terfezia claveryi]